MGDDQEVRDVDGEEAAVEVINPDNDDERMVVGRADFSSDAFIGIGGESSVRCSAAVRSADGTSLVKKCCFDTPSSTFFWDPEMTPGSADPNVGAYENPDDGGTGAPINTHDDPARLNGRCRRSTLRRPRARRIRPPTHRALPPRRPRRLNRLTVDQRPRPLYF